MIKKRWTTPAAVSDEVARQLEQYSPVERGLLASRGLRALQAAESFLARRFEGDTEPGAMADLPKAVDRLMEARQRTEQVVVYGDYDADGITSTALLTEALTMAGLQARWYVPSRFEEGYGLNAEALRRLAESGADLVVTVDCGIRAVEIVQQAPVEIIVTDHHLPGERIPPATAVLNPHRSDDDYPFKGLSGVGIAYKLAQGIFRQAGLQDESQLLDLVAVGTVADLAPLVDENRQLVWQGLERLNQAARPGLRALAEYAGYGMGSMSTTAIGFGIGPRLNAAGRLGDAGDAVKLLLTPSGPEAWQRAKALDELNGERRQLTIDTLERARVAADSQRLAEHLIVAVGDDFHEGVVGLVASRLAEEAYRPALVCVRDGERVTGSARSIPQFHVTRALDGCADLLIKYGGHARAAGFTLATEDLDEFAERMDAAARQAFEQAEPVPVIQVDAVLGFDQLGDGLMQFIDRLEPCGEANPYPVFQTNNVVVLSKRAVGARNDHLKLSLRHNGVVFDAIGFRLGSWVTRLPRVIDLVYRLERNEFRGVVSLQLNVQDLRPSQIAEA